MTPRVAVAAVVVVLALAASFHFVVAETGVADQCSPVGVLHPNRVALFSAGVPQVKVPGLFPLFWTGTTWFRCHFSVLFSLLFPDHFRLSVSSSSPTLSQVL